ncbi:MAG: TonB-dependent receptor [Saprospiraceae bacterium]
MKKLQLAALLLFLACYGHAQIKILGNITDTRGVPLPGATIQVLGSAKGTTSDLEGTFELMLPEAGSYDLQASYVGYKTATLRLNIAEGEKVKEVLIKLEEEATVLQTLTLKATRMGATTPFATQVITKEELESKNLGQDLPFLLEDAPSVVVTSDAGAGIGYTGIRIRGTDATRINVTINGVPLNDAESQGVFWVDLPDFASSAADIQIERGVGSSTNGPGAFGATINLNTSLLEHSEYAEANLGIGSFGTRKRNFQFGTGLMPYKGNQDVGFTLDGRLSHINSDGYIDRARADLESFFVSGAFIGNKSALRANVFSGHEETYQAWNGVPAQWVNDDKLRRYNSAGTEKPGLPYEDEVDDYTQTHYQLHFDHHVNDRLDLGLSAFTTTGKGFFEQYKADEERSRYLLNDTLPDCCYDFVRRRWLDNVFFGTLWTLDYHSDDDRLNLTLGGIVSKYSGDHFGELIDGELLLPNQFGHRYYFSNGVKKDFTTYLKSRYRPSDALSLFAELQLRRVDYHTEGTNNDLLAFKVSADHSFFNPKAGFVYEPIQDWFLNGSIAVGQREPNRDDYIDALNGQPVKPEKVVDYELGVSHVSPYHSYALNAYYMNYKDQLVLTGNINDVGETIRQNVDKSYRYGVELSASVAPASRLTLSGNATLSRNKIEGFTEYIDNWDTGEQEVVFHGTTDIAFSPNFIAFGKISYDLFASRRVDANLAFTLKHVGKQYIDNTSNENTTLEAYTVGGLHLKVGIVTSRFDEVLLNFRVNNLFDARYSANAWTYRYISPSYDARPDDPYARLESGSTYNLTGFYPQAGRNFLLGLTIRI